MLDFLFDRRQLGTSYGDHPEKPMAPHSSTLDWKIPWTEEPGRLQSMGHRKVEHNGTTKHSILALIES